MCGIAGIVFKDKRPEYIKQVNAMIDLVRHRGPDDSGIEEGQKFIFGHRRLAILDLSIAGHQPMFYGGRYVISYNGEVYNYLELRRELQSQGYSFNSHTDTEVILAAYDYWGEKCVEKFNGMFAFGLYDIKEQCLFLARDRAGVKPIYYYRGINALYFFSEPKQVIIPKIVEAEPNDEAVYNYLAFQFSINHTTLFKGIYRLAPGTYAVYKKNSLSITRYWSPCQFTRTSNIGYAKAREQVLSLLEDAVRLRLRSDVPLGCYLSGGIDSSIISGIAAKHTDRINTFTFAFSGNSAVDEAEDAKIVSRRIGSAHEEIFLEEDEILNTWQAATYFMDYPQVGFSLIPQMRVPLQVEKQVKVILGGQGGDELFFGYGWYNALINKSLFTSIPNISLIRRLSLAATNVVNCRNGNFLSRARTLINQQRDHYESYFGIMSGFTCYGLINKKHQLPLKDYYYSILVNGEFTLEKLREFEYRFWLEAILQVEDRTSMASSVESRVPFMDHRLAELAFQLPSTYCLDGCTNKKILKDAFKDLLCMEILGKKMKQGYVAPIGQWLADKSVKEFTNCVLRNKKSFIYNYIAFPPKKFTYRQLWMLLSLEIWHKLFITREISVNYLNNKPGRKWEVVDMNN